MAHSCKVHPWVDRIQISNSQHRRWTYISRTIKSCSICFKKTKRSLRIQSLLQTASLILHNPNIQYLEHRWRTNISITIKFYWRCFKKTEKSPGILQQEWPTLADCFPQLAESKHIITRTSAADTYFKNILQSWRRFKKTEKSLGFFDKNEPLLPTRSLN